MTPEGSDAATRYRRLFEGVPVGLYSTTPDGRFLDANPAFLRMLGYVDLPSLNAVRAVDCYVDPGRRQEWQARVERDGIVLGFVVELRRRDGSTLWVRNSGRAVKDEHGAVAYYEGFVEDVTEWRAADQALERTVSVLRATLEATGDGLLVADLGGRILTYNQRFAEIWRLPRDVLESGDEREALACALELLVEPRAFLSRVRAIYADAEADAVDLVALRDGRILERHAYPQRIDGRAVGRVWSFRDVTDSKRAEETLRASEARLRLIVEQMPALLWTTATDLRFKSLEGAALVALGLNPNQLKGVGVQEYFSQADADVVVDAHRRALAGESVAFATAWQGRGFQCHVEPLLGPERRVVGVVGIGLDTAERDAAAAALRASERRYRMLFERNLAGVYRATLDGRFLDCNDACARIFGYASPAELRSERVQALYADPEDRAEFLTRLLHQRTITNYEMRYRRRDGTVIWTLENATLLEEDSGDPGLLEGTLVDITDRKRAEAQVEFQAYHDALTRLPNRVLLKDRLAVALAHAQRMRQPLAVMFLDLDHFKLVNDTLGHSVGDQLLQAVAVRLVSSVRRDDTVSRVGGDEFTILFPELARGDDAARMAQKILEAVSQPFAIEGHDIYVTTSLGISLFPDDGEDSESLLKNADSAMYRAKDLGRNTYQLCTPGMSVRALERMALENRLRRAVERNEFVLHYQPLVDMASGAFVGCEALLRWQHPERGLLQPDTFISLAEESRLILPVGEWALRAACGQMRRWQDEGCAGLRLAVNLSARQFQQQDLASRIERILAETGMPAESLELEVTESIAMQNAEWTTGVLRQLRGMGVRISIDDFGTGQSSLSYLKYFPLSTVKIDRSFVKDIAVDPDDEAIVTAVIALAHSLGLKVIAEGVETEEQHAFLRDAGCDESQGYLFSPPRPADEMRTLLLSRRPGASGAV